MYVSEERMTDRLYCGSPSVITGPVGTKLTILGEVMVILAFGGTVCSGVPDYLKSSEANQYKKDLISTR